MLFFALNSTPLRFRSALPSYTSYLNDLYGYGALQYEYSSGIAHGIWLSNKTTNISRPVNASPKTGNTP